MIPINRRVEVVVPALAILLGLSKVATVGLNEHLILNFKPLERCILAEDLEEQLVLFSGPSFVGLAGFEMSLPLEVTVGCILEGKSGCDDGPVSERLGLARESLLGVREIFGEYYNTGE